MTTKIKPSQATTKGRVVSPLATGVFLGIPLDDAAPLPEAPPNVLSIYPYVHDRLFLLNEAMKRDLSQVERLRFDPVNVCNLRCTFCPQALDHRMAQIQPDELKPLLSAIAPTCKRINFGCGFEPMFPKNFTEYGQVIRDAIENEFANFPIVSVTTNGLWFGQRELGPFVDILSWVHVSCHSHKAEVFEKIEVGASFEVVENNIRMLRRTYPDLRIHLECVLTKLNGPDAPDYIAWAFDRMDVNSINLRRMDAGIQTNDDSPLDKANKAGMEQQLTDEEWFRLVDSISHAYPAVLSQAATGPTRAIDTIELTKSEIYPD